MNAKRSSDGSTPTSHEVPLTPHLPESSLAAEFDAACAFRAVSSGDAMERQEIRWPRGGTALRHGRRSFSGNRSQAQRQRGARVMAAMTPRRTSPPRLGAEVAHTHKHQIIMCAESVGLVAESRLVTAVRSAGGACPLARQTTTPCLRPFALSMVLGGFGAKHK